MGILLKEIYERADQLGGIKAKIQLAKHTLCGSQDAEALPDTPENVAKFRAALQKVEAEFKAAANVQSRSL
jgi:hypothetical protein